MPNYVVEGNAGIHDEIAAIVLLASTYAEPVNMSFKGVELVADPKFAAGEQLVSLRVQYEVVCARQYRDYQSQVSRTSNTPGLETIRTEAAQAQAHADNLLAELQTLDWTYPGDLVEYLVELTEVTDDVRVSYDADQVSDAFKDHGYVIGESFYPLLEHYYENLILHMVAMLRMRSTLRTPVITL